uniref:Uncharacterized protein n=1 Tax=Anguilla anguilla TaxID=7936 RepID=A0A0E9XXY9_ANGAN
MRHPGPYKISQILIYKSFIMQLNKSSQPL